VVLANARLHRRERVQAEERRIANLTDAERRVADLVAQGLSNRQVANRVFPEPAHRRVSPAPHLLEARRHLTGAARADDRRAGQLDWQRKHTVIRKQ
jgi:hypothetical protein